MDILKESAGNMAQSLAAQLDDVLRTAINRKLGRDDWELESLRGRLELRTFPGNEVEIYCLDGAEILELYPAKFETTHDGVITRLTATRNYRLLTPNL